MAFFPANLPQLNTSGKILLGSVAGFRMAMIVAEELLLRLLNRFLSGTDPQLIIDTY